MYNLETCQEICTFEGHTWTVTAIDLEHELPHMLCTGCGDKK